MIYMDGAEAVAAGLGKLSSMQALNVSGMDMRCNVAEVLHSCGASLHTKKHLHVQNVTSATTERRRWQPLCARCQACKR